MFPGYAFVSRPRHHPQRAAAQSEGDHRRAAPAGSDGDHRALGSREELARLRHALRRGSATLHRVAVHVRQAVPRAHAQTPGGLTRGDLARGGHRAEEPHHYEPLHRGHGNRDLRLPPAALGAGGDAVLRAVRRSREDGYGAGGGGRADNRTRNAEVGTRCDQFRVPTSAFRRPHHVSVAGLRAPSRRRGGRSAAGGGIRASPARRRRGAAGRERRRAARAGGGGGAGRGGPARRRRSEPWAACGRRGDGIQRG